MSGQTNKLDIVKGFPTRSISAPATNQPSVHPNKPSPLRNLSEHAASLSFSPQGSASPRGDTSPGKDTPALDLVGHLQRSESSVVKTRSGSVLTRGFILKTDHYPSGKLRHTTSGGTPSNTYPHQDAHWILISMSMELPTLELPVYAVSMSLVRPNPGHRDFVPFYLFYALGPILRTPPTWSGFRRVKNQ